MWKSDTNFLLLGTFCALVGLFAVVISDQSVYCDPKMCPSYNNQPRHHIGCGNNGHFKSNCSADAEIIEMTKEKKILFLKLHNRLRDRFARGKVPGFKTAARMPMLKWNDELAKLAELNVRTCNFEHDQCRATKACPYAGQNLGWMANSAHFPDENFIIKNLTREWFYEYRFAKQEHTNNYTVGRVPEGQIGHFTAFIHDKSDKVGCAVSKFTGNSKTFGGLNGYHDYKEYLVACNYCYTNMLYERSYTTGPTCSQCKDKKCGSIYKGLCKESDAEPIPDVYQKGRGKKNK
uniref:Antigen 5-related protein n=1 Tax=Sergentomyia schwetzi TaxID=114605 RepID=A0A6B9VJN7_9DIPT|nr:antigen 5-related protein [Sergentomyia schwetzi]